MAWYWWGDIAPEDRTIIQELIDEKTDRGAAIVAMAILDERLKTLLEHHFIKDENLEKHLFGLDRPPLGTLAGKIHVLYALGIISSVTHGDLIAMSRIRNEFAHYSLRKFDTPEIAKQCKKLSFPYRIIYEYPDGRPEEELKSDRDKFLFKVQFMFQSIRRVLSEPPAFGTPKF
jgi:DNA-binding MltR family transcriptional regulator